MSERQNLFRPIHKGIRSMLYELGNGLQTTDFADVAESNQFAARLKHDLGDSLSNCILCLLTVHSRHEEKDIFSKLQVHDPDAVALVMKEHVEVARRVREVSKTCDEITALTSPARRIEIGDRLQQELNDLFVTYLSHLNNEEALLVPLMWGWFTDEQLGAMRAQFYGGLPPPLFETWMNWTLPALNVNELVVLLSGMKTDPPPNRFEDALRLAEKKLDPQLWMTVKGRLGLAAA